MKVSKKCNEINRNIFVYNYLKETEKQKLLKHIKHCDKCKSLFYEVFGLSDNHIDDLLLIDYSIMDISSIERILSQIEVSRIDSHLENCQLCKQRYQVFQSQYLEMSEYWDNSDYPNFIIYPAIEKNKNTKKLTISNQSIGKAEYHGIYKKLLAFAAILIFIFLFTAIDWNPSYLHDFAIVEDTKIPVTVRGSGSDDLQKGIISFNQKKYSAAAIFFQQYLIIDNNEYIRYLLGLSYLKSAFNYKNIDIVLVEMGIVELEKILYTTNNQNIKENTMWLLSKGYYIKGDVQKTIEYLNKIFLMNGDKANKSMEIIKEIESTIR